MRSRLCGGDREDELAAVATLRPGSPLGKADGKPYWPRAAYSTSLFEHSESGSCARVLLISYSPWSSYYGRCSPGE
jgi:hypothetical protein